MDVAQTIHIHNNTERAHIHRLTRNLVAFSCPLRQDDDAAAKEDGEKEDQITVEAAAKGGEEGDEDKTDSPGGKSADDAGCGGDGDMEMKDV